jgi:hypothetical protein
VRKKSRAKDQRDADTENNCSRELPKLHRCVFARSPAVCLLVLRRGL